MENIKHEEFLRFLQHTFPFGMPEQFSILDGDFLSKVDVLFKNQEGRNFYQLNYAEFLSDYFALAAPILKEKWKDRTGFTIEEIAEFRANNRQIIALIYLKEIQSENTSPWRKVELCFFLISFFSTAKEIYGIEFIDNQDDFLGKVKAFKEYIENNLKQAEEQSKAIAISAYSLWKYGNEKLNLLNQLLKQHQFLDESSSITHIYSHNSMPKAVWKGKQGALVYMLFLLNGRQNEIGNLTISNFASRWFTISDKVLDAEKLSKSLFDMKNRFQGADVAKPEYLILLEQITEKVIS